MQGRLTWPGLPTRCVTLPVRVTGMHAQDHLRMRLIMVIAVILPPNVTCARTSAMCYWLVFVHHVLAVLQRRAKASAIFTLR